MESTIEVTQFNVHVVPAKDETVVISHEDLNRKIDALSLKSANSISHDAEIVHVNELEEKERSERMERGRDNQLAYEYAVVNRELHQKIPLVGGPTVGETALDVASNVAVGMKDAVVDNAPIVAEQVKDASIATGHFIAENAPIVAENLKNATLATAHVVAENAPIVAEAMADKMREGAAYTANVVSENAPIVAEKLKDASIRTANAIVEGAPVLAHNMEDAAITTAHAIVDGAPIVAEHMVEGGASLLSKLGEVAYNASAVITGSVLDAVEPYASKVIDKLGDIEESVENTLKGYVNTGKSALGMKVETTATTPSTTAADSWKVVDKLEEAERQRRMSVEDKDVTLLAAKHAVEQELVDTVVKTSN